MTRTLRCDFCLKPEVTHTCPTEHFVMGVTETLGIEDHPDWGACERCAALVERSDRYKLVRRMAGQFRMNHPEVVEGLSVDEQVELMEGIVGEFWRHRSGPPHPVTADERAAAEAGPARGIRSGPEPPPPPGWIKDFLDPARRRGAS